MIAFVDKAPTVELHGEHFRMTVTSGAEEAQFLLTATAFYCLKVQCAEAFAKRQLAELEARENLIPFPKPSKKVKR